MLSRRAIKSLMAKGLIQVTPEPAKIGPNSIDLRLGDELKMYAQPSHSKPFRMEWQQLDQLNGRVAVRDPVNGATYYAIDPKSPPPLVDVPKLPDGRWLLTPGQFYLGRTLEETFCRGVVPTLDGRSTCGRLSIEAHKTAGVGDNGFRGRWTLEIEVTEPVLVAPGDRLFQIYFEPCWGEGMADLISKSSTGWFQRMSRDGRVTPLSLNGLLELEDLYDGHYQASGEIRGAHPLDDK